MGSKCLRGFKVNLPILYAVSSPHLKAIYPWANSWKHNANISEIDINIRTIEGNYSATVGIQNASGTIASQVDTYNGNYFNNNMSIRFKKPFIPSDWLILSAEDGGSLYGDLYDGQSEQINIEIDSQIYCQAVNVKR